MNTEELRLEIAKSQKAMRSKPWDSYFKYFNDSPAVMDGIFKNQKIRFTQPRALNDPLEFSPTFRFNNPDSAYRTYELDGLRLPSIELFFRVQIIESQINNYGILSVTKHPDSFDMWSHYSNGHKGFVIEFKEGFWQYPALKSRTGEQYPARKVEYVNDYSINLDKIADADGHISVPSIHDELFYKKTSRWKHEDEYRMVRPLTDSPEYSLPTENHVYTDLGLYLFPFDIECISSIILGASMSIANKQIVSQFCENHNIPYSQAIVLRDYKDRLNKPSMVFLMSVVSLREKQIVLNSQPQSFCSDTIHYGHQSTVTLSHIKELPYYELYPDLVEEFYADLLKANKPPTS